MRVFHIARFLAVIMVATVAWFGTFSAQAAVIHTVVGGQLTGAKNVNVLGTLYDVEFLDGSCRSLFDDCDEISDFTFQSLSAATAAATALLDQVFLDIGPGQEFDTQPTLTFGCPGTTGILCMSFIPYATRVVNGADFFVRAEARNFSSVEGDPADPPDAVTGDSALGIDFSTEGNLLITARSANFAVFAPSPVPVPAALPLFLSGLGLMGFVGWRRRRIAA